MMGHSFSVVTYNIRFDAGEDGAHAWRRRRASTIAAIASCHPDLLGVQEARIGQRAELCEAFPELALVRTAGADSEGAGQHPPRGFVRTSRFVVRDSGMFWLANTPHVAGSVSWPTDYGPSTCCWALLHDRDADRELVFANTHFDTNQHAWLPSARAIHAELDRLAGTIAIVLVGDFNCSAGSGPHRYLLNQAGYQDAWTDAGHTDAGFVTFNGFTDCPRLPDGGHALEQWLETVSHPIEVFDHYRAHVRTHGNYRIDWILFRGPLRCHAASIDRRTVEGVPPSDHYPVAATLSWKIE
jgi:endonuclease/exonuclease/phosphatase family metal-dependent hydrolase